MPQKLSQGTSSIFLSDGILPSTNLTPTIHPVVQGTFYSENFISHFHDDHINGIKKILNKNTLIIIPGISHYTFVIDLMYNYLHTGDKRCGSISLMLDCLSALSSAKINSS